MLTDSMNLLFFFRWETLDSFMQHDVQELCRVVSNYSIESDLTDCRSNLSSCKESNTYNSGDDIYHKLVYIIRPTVPLETIVTLDAGVSRGVPT